MPKILYLIFIFHLCNSLYAQDYKFGKVSLADLKKAKSEIDTSAPAELLVKKVDIAFDDKYHLYYDIFVRVKIYDKSKAEEHLTEVINLHKNYKLTNFKAITFNLERDKIEESQLEKSQKFEVSLNSKAKSYRASFPNVKNGSVIDFKYSIYTENYYFPIQYFQFDIPLVHGSFYFEYPEVIYYKGELKGEYFPSKTKQSVKFWNSNYSANVIEYEFDNIKPYIKEPYVINKNNSRTSVKYELTGVYIPGVVYKNISGDWKNVAETLLDDSDFGKQIISNSKIEEYAESIVKNETDTLKIAKLILDHIHSEFKWNEDDGLLTDEGTKYCLSNKVGNVAELNLLLLSLLRAKGIKSYPIGISTFEHGVINQAFPSLNSFNYIIVGVKANNKMNFLDASNKYSNVNILPIKYINTIGYLLDEKFVDQVEIKNSVDSRIYNAVDAEFDDNMEIKANSKLFMGSFFAIKMMDLFDDEMKFSKEVESLLNIKLDSFSKSYNKNVVEVNYNFIEKNNIDQVDNKLIFNPLLNMHNEKNPFNVEKRYNFIEFGSPYQITNKIKIKIPKGYKIESMPKSKKMVYENSGEYTYSIKDYENYIEVVSNFKILRSFFLQDEFTVLRDLWKFRNESESQLIIMIKDN